jgi:hypothetical protein
VLALALCVRGVGPGSYGRRSSEWEVSPEGFDALPRASQSSFLLEIRRETLEANPRNRHSELASRGAREAPPRGEESGD